MSKEEYIKRFIAHMCEVAAFSSDDALVIAEAESFWWEHASGDASPTPESDAAEAMTNWEE